MRRLLLVLPLATTLALTAGCLGLSPTAAPERQHTAQKTISLNGRQHVSLTGVAKAPASLISNNMAGSLGKTGLISNNSAGLSSNNTAGFALLALEALEPVANADVTLVDQFRKPVAGVVPVKSGADGSFVLKNVPAGLSWTIQVSAPGLTLTRLAKADGGTVEVTPETTLATEHLHDTTADKGTLLQVSKPAFEALTEQLKASIEAADVANGLPDSHAALTAYEKVAAKNPNVAKATAEVVEEAAEAVEEAVADGSLPIEVVASGAEAIVETEPSTEPSAEPSTEASNAPSTEAKPTSSPSKAPSAASSKAPSTPSGKGKPR